MMKRMPVQAEKSSREPFRIEVDAETMTLVRKCAEHEGMKVEEVLSHLVRKYLMATKATR